MRKWFWLGVMIAWTSPGAAFAQGAASSQPPQRPGSASVSTGTPAPSEGGTGVSCVTTGKGFTPPSPWLGDVTGVTPTRFDA